MPLDASAAAASLANRSLASLGLKAGAPLTLPPLLEAAVTHSPDAAAARAEAESVAAAVISASARPNPAVSWTPAVVTPQQSGALPWSMGFALDFPLETAGKRKSRIAQAREEANAAALRAVDTIWQVRSRVRDAWLDLFAAEQRSEVLERQIETQEQMLAAQEARLKAGESSRTELTQTRLWLNQSRLAASGARKSAAEARASLASALFLPSALLDGVSFDFSQTGAPPAPPQESELRQNALLLRPDVLASLADYGAAEAALRSEIAKQYPDLSLGPAYEFDQNQSRWTLGVSLTLPVFNHNEGPIAEAEAKRSAAAAKFAAVQAQVSGELDRALASYRGARDKLRVASEVARSSEEQRLSAERMLQGGEGDRLSLLAAQVESDAAILGRLEVLIETREALAALEDASRTPLTR